MELKVRSNIMRDGRLVCIDDMPEAERIAVLTAINVDVGKRVAAAMGLTVEFEGFEERGAV
jgi:hypothetical protein